MTLGEFFSVDHERKTGTFYQVSDVMPQHKGYTIRQVAEVRRRLQMHSAHYTLRLVYIVDASTSPSSIRGWAFKREDGTYDHVPGLGSVEGFVVRAPLDPSKLPLVAKSRQTFEEGADLSGWPTKELKAELKQRGLKQTGTRHELVDRLLNDLE